MKQALITGITGQDGSYLAEFLLGKGYRIYGLVRRTGEDTTGRIAHLLDRVTLIQGDLLDQGSLIRALDESKPNEVYNLGAQSFVATSWKEPILTAEVTAIGVARLLDSIRQVDPGIRFYQASSSEMFGNTSESAQSETTPFHPRSPYGIAKLFGHETTINFRESFGIFACSGILFNHESPRRGKEFVTRKITDHVARIKLGLCKKLPLGDLHPKRDWGYAGDYVEAMWLMLQQETPQDFVVGTGVAHSVRDFMEAAFQHVGLPWMHHVEYDPNLQRPAEIYHLVGDSSKARRILGWKPKVGFEDLVGMMVDEDLRRYAGDRGQR